MNNLRRKRILDLIHHLDALKNILYDIRYEEESYMDNIPENLQTSTRYDDAEEAFDHLDNAYDKLEDCINELQEINMRGVR